MRLLRFVVWAAAMCVAGVVVGMYNPRRAVFVPCIFLAIMVPAVLLPMQPKEDRTG